MVFLPAEQLAAFALASLVFIVAPGPDTMMLLGQGMSRGRKAGIGVAVGCALGCLLHTALAAIGVTAILASSDTAFRIFKYAGAAYLFYLGIKTLHSTSGAVALPAAAAGEAPLSAFILRGFLSNALNPKVALFFLSFLPQFVDPASAAVSAQLAMLGACFAAMLLAVFVVFGYFSGAVGSWLTANPRFGRWLDRMAGGVCIVLAVRLALTERKA